MARFRKSTTDALLERLADAEHDGWSRWMTYLFSRCTWQADGAAIIPAELVERWSRQATTLYAHLSEREKESDRDEVRRILPLIEATYAPGDEPLIASYTHEGAVRMIDGEEAAPA